MVRKKSWRKVLYENQGYPDNYTDSSFLQELKKNINRQDVGYRDAFLGAGLVTEHLCSIVIFIVIFTFMYNLWIEPEIIFVICGSICLLVYLIIAMTSSKTFSYDVIYKDLKTVVKYLVFGYVLSPILKTLTDSISTDTIYATTTFMMLIRLTFFDYKVSAVIVSNSLSLNAAIFGSICLASRLASPLHAFILLTLSIKCFVLFPFLIYKIGRNIFMLLGTLTITTIFLGLVSEIMLTLFLILVLFINGIFPYLFVRWQSYRDNIYGPWDEAIVQDMDD